MKVNVRFCFLSLVALLFVASLTSVPRETSASKDEDKKDRSASTRPDSKSREGNTESESVRERDSRPESTSAQPPTHEKPGALKRIAGFFKGLFVARSKAAEAREELDGEGDDPDLPRFLRGWSVPAVAP